MACQAVAIGHFQGRCVCMHMPLGIDMYACVAIGHFQGRCEAKIGPTSPGPHATFLLTSPGPHVILIWQGAIYLEGTERATISHCLMTRYVYACTCTHACACMCTERATISHCLMRWLDGTGVCLLLAYLLTCLLA